MTSEEYLNLNSKSADEETNKGLFHPAGSAPMVDVVDTELRGERDT
jgi:hypothetical protein